MYVPIAQIIKFVPSHPYPPQILVVDRPFDWIPAVALAIGGLQSIGAMALTWYIFRSNAKQKVKERHAEWFHKVCVDPSTDTCFKFFAKAGASLEAAAEAVNMRLGDHAGNMQKRDELIFEAIGPKSAFKKGLGRAGREIQDNVHPFDPVAAQEIFNRFLKLDDDVSEWFDKLVWVPTADRRDSLYAILSTCKSEIFNMLRKCEFKHWA